jgi:hypothetical protein
MAHQESLPHLRQVVQEILRSEVVEELLRDVECAPRQGDFAVPFSTISARLAAKLWVTWAAEAGAPIVTTAAASGTRDAAASTAAPPRLWPISKDGTPWF